MQRCSSVIHVGVLIVAGLFGAAVVIAGVRWRYAVALEQIRRQWPEARLCAYEYQQTAMLLAPGGALVGIVLAEWELGRRRQRRRRVSG